MDVNKEELKASYQSKTVNELLELHTGGTLTKVAYDILEYEMQSRDIPLPERPVSKEEPTDPEESTENQTWEVKSEDGQVNEYSDEGTIVEQLLSNQIKPDDECRRILKQTSDKKDTKIVWKKVSDDLVKSNFKFRVLFEPVWAHTVKGAGVGAILGVLIWLGNGIFIFSVYSQKLGTVAVFALFFYLFSGSLVPKPLQKAFGVLLFLLIILLLKNGYSLTLRDVSDGFIAQVGALLAGAIAGVFPGMVIGSVVGLVRHNSLPTAPSATAENYTPIIFKGIIIPLIIFLTLATLYIVYAPILVEKYYS